MTTQGQKDAATAITQIWETGDVQEASDRCDAVTEMCRMGYESASAETQEYGDEAEQEAIEWKRLERAAIREYNDHCPAFLNG